MSPARGTRVLGYVRVSTEEQSASLEVQRQQIERYCELYGLTLVGVVVDQGASGRSLEREGFRRAMDAVEAGEVGGLVIAKLDRLTRSVRDLASLLERADREGWDLCSVAEQLDTRTAGGRLVANVLGAVAQWEREVISERTKAALAVKRAQGIVGGRRREQEDPETVAQLRAWREEGKTLEAIAEAAEAAGLRTLRGGKWHPTTVARLLRRG